METVSGRDPAAGYTTMQVHEIIGASYRQLDHWERTGIVRASIVPANGSGSHRVWSYADLRVAAVFTELSNSARSLIRLRPLADIIYENPEHGYVVVGRSDQVATFATLDEAIEHAHGHPVATLIAVDVLLDSADLEETG